MDDETPEEQSKTNRLQISVGNRDLDRAWPDQVHDKTAVDQRVAASLRWKVSEEVVLERVSSDPYELSYACLLIPRFEVHGLVGDLGEDLRGLMKQICTSQGWSLDFLAIEPQYLQWIVRARAATSPRNIMQFFRVQTSRNILENFPLIAQQNLSHDFWAPPYIMIVGREPHPKGRVEEFIRLTRKQQQFQNRRGS